MNIAVFASGRGSNFLSILNACKSGSIPARISVLITNNENAGAREIAKSEHIPDVHFSRAHFKTDVEYAQHLLNLLKDSNTSCIALAGYLKKIPALVVREFHNRILNIHPALLPLFGGEGMYGRYVHEEVLASGMKVSGATVHFVNEEYDRGAILIQRCVPVERFDTSETLAAKVLEVEHTIYPLALKALVEERVVFEGNKAWILE